MKTTFGKIMLTYIVCIIIAFFNATSYAFFIDFEAGQGKNSNQIVDYPDLNFFTTDGYKWLYCDISTGLYNAHSVDLGLRYGSGAYNMYGKVSAWLGPAQGRGIIEFSQKNGTWFKVGYSSATTFYLEAYDENDNLISSALGNPNLYSEDMNFLKVEAPQGSKIAYVKMHDSGNFWTVDNISGDAMKPNRYAVLCGKDPWVSDMSKWLQKVGWKKENIASYPEKSFDKEWITELANNNVIKANDEFLFYYAGHGSYGGNNGETKPGSFTVTVNDTPFTTKTYTIAYAADELLSIKNNSEISDDFLTNIFKENPVWEKVRKTFILDSCLSGGFWGGNDSDNSGDLDRLENTRLIAATSETGLAPWFPGINWTYLTYSVLDNALNKKKADKNKDGLITIPEIVEYVKNNATSKFWGPAYIFGASDKGAFDANDKVYDYTQEIAYYSNIPLNQEIFEFGSYEVINETKEIEIDIKPGSFPNAINLESNGVVPVAILAKSIDVMTIHPTTITFQGSSPVRWSYEDVDDDGAIDLVIHFRTETIVMDSKETAMATLIGATYDGTNVIGTDNLTIVPRNAGKDIK